MVVPDGAFGLSEGKELLITADGGGSNGSRNRLWKVCLQELADETGLQIVVCHFPPGTSKWNKIEHRMFCHITENWRGKPSGEPCSRREPDREHPNTDVDYASRRNSIPISMRRGSR